MTREERLNMLGLKEETVRGVAISPPVFLNLLREKRRRRNQKILNLLVIICGMIQATMLALGVADGILSPLQGVILCGLVALFVSLWTFVWNEK